MTLVFKVAVVLIPTLLIADPSLANGKLRKAGVNSSNNDGNNHMCTKGYKFKENLTDYGKKGIRLMRMRQEGDVYYIKEFTVDVEIKLATHNEYQYGNNSMVFATDTIMNRVNALAKETGIDTAEQFGLDICQTHLDAYEQVVECKAYIEEVPWKRMDNHGMEHNHAFISNPEAVKFAEIQRKRGDIPKVYAGLKNMRIIKTTRFQFLGFFMDDYTSLPESDKWLLSTEVWLKWLYTDNTNFDEAWESVKNITLEVFSGPPETGEVVNSIHQAAYKIVEEILNDISEIQEASIEIPLYPYFLANLAKIGMENKLEVFAPTDSPYGYARASLKRSC